jgi:hypothetical protein
MLIKVFSTGGGTLYTLNLYLDDTNTIQNFSSPGMSYENNAFEYCTVQMTSVTQPLLGPVTGDEVFGHLGFGMTDIGLDHM